MAENITAFPVPEVPNEVGAGVTAKNQGMTLRDYFASQVIGALMTIHHGNPKMTPLDVAKAAYQQADMMINVR